MERLNANIDSREYFTKVAVPIKETNRESLTDRELHSQTQLYGAMDGNLFNSSGTLNGKYGTMSNKETQDQTQVEDKVQLGLSTSNSQHTYIGTRMVNSGHDVYALHKDIIRPGTV